MGSGLLRSTRGERDRGLPLVSVGVHAPMDGCDRATEVGGDPAEAVAVPDVRGHGQVERTGPDPGSTAIDSGRDNEVLDLWDRSRGACVGATASVEEDRTIRARDGQVVSRAAKFA